MPRPGGRDMTHTETQLQAALFRLLRDAADEVVARWRAAVAGEPLCGVGELQREVPRAIAQTNTVRRHRSMQRLACRLGERGPELAELVHQLVVLRQVLHAVLSERLEPVAAAKAEYHVNTAIDILVEACTRATTERLTAAAFVDPLTGLPNRHALDRDLSQRVVLAARADRPLTVVVADLNGLKTINDRDGHAAGDQALRALADGLHSALRGGDAAYRIGGDEFLIVLPDTTAEDAEKVVARVIGKSPSFGWGAATLPADGIDAAALIQLADQRLIGHRRNARRPDHDTVASGRTTSRQRSRRVVAAAALAAAGVLGGGLAFAAEGILASAQNRGSSPARASTTLANPSVDRVAGPTATTVANGSGAPEDKSLDAMRRPTVGGLTTTTTAGIIAALIEDTTIEPLAPAISFVDPDVSIRVADLDEALQLEPVEPAEVLGEVIGRDPDPEPSPKPAKPPRSSAKQRRS